MIWKSWDSCGSLLVKPRYKKINHDGKPADAIAKGRFHTAVGAQKIPADSLFRYSIMYETNTLQLSS